MRLLPLLGIGFFFSACVSFSVTTSTPVATDATRQVTAGKGFGLTSDHDGKVVTVDPDTDVIRVVLEDGWDWKVQADPAYLRLQQSGPLIGNGFTAQFWLFKLIQTGETKITGTGSPACRGATPPCAMPDRLYAVTLRTADASRSALPSAYSQYVAAQHANATLKVRYDQADYHAIYALTDETFRARTSEAEMTTMLGDIRQRLGKSQGMRERTHETAPLGTTADVLVTFVMSSTFDNGTATETLAWRVTPSNVTYLVRYQLE